MIELNEFDISYKEYQKLVFRQTLLFCVFPYIALWLFMTIMSNLPSVASLGLLIFLLGIAYLVYRMTGHQYGVSPKNTWLYQKRKISFDADKVHFHAEDGLEAHIPLSHILKIDRSGGYYRLFFLNRFTAYILIPVSAFHSEEDRMRFETEILMKISPRATLWKKIGITLLILVCLGYVGWALMLRSNRANSGRCCEIRHTVPTEQISMLLTTNNHLNLCDLRALRG